MISDNRVWRQAFNFDTSDSMEPINSGGKKTADHQWEIAKVLLQDDPSGKWVAADIKTLGNVIKNRIHGLRKKYFELRNELGATGHGLIEDERELEIWDDSAISNVWEKIQKIFPWYKDLSRLLKASPVVDREASVNSATDLDLMVLGTLCSQPSSLSRALSMEDLVHSDESEDEEMVEGGPGSPHLDEQDPDERMTKVGGSTMGTCVPQGSMPVASQVSTKGGRLFFVDKASELAASQNAAIGAIIHKNNEARGVRKKMDADTTLQIKRMELDHELHMMEKRVALEHQYEMARLERSSWGAFNAASSIPSSSSHGMHSQALTNFNSDFGLASALGTPALGFFPNASFQEYTPQ
ncbi:hypothetical protein K439DRAFT_1618686 [Ramaria rubella]|nr:hypothetical protein K439DRAFT_1618686 [Ramaria rubella]